MFILNEQRMNKLLFFLCVSYDWTRQNGINI